MRGKKRNPEFVSSFLKECLGQGLMTPGAMRQQAETRLIEIEKQIRLVEQLKLERSNLLDVIEVLGEKTPQVLPEVRVLDLFRLPSPELCKQLCDLSEKNELNLRTPMADDSRFCLKQLLEFRVLTRMDENILPGERYEEYRKFVLLQG